MQLAQLQPAVLAFFAVYLLIAVAALIALAGTSHGVQFRCRDNDTVDDINPAILDYGNYGIFLRGLVLCI